MLSPDMAHIALKKLLGVPADCASSLVATPQLASYLSKSYDKARAAHAPFVPTVTTRDQVIVDDLRQDGVHVTSVETLDLPGSAALLAEGRQLYARFCRDGRPGQSPLARSFQAGAAEIMTNRGIFFWGLQDRLLDIVEAYLGVPVGYDGLNIFFTKADGRQSAARRWHRDVEDRRMVKIAVYMNDVDDAGGPLQVLRRRLPDHDRTVRGKFPILKQLELEQALPDFEEERDVITCCRKAGTVVFADTASFYHRGKPATERDRCAVYFNYFHKVPLRPFRCERSTISRAQIVELASGLPPRQRDSLLWRDRLPILARLVPPAPVWDRAADRGSVVTGGLQALVGMSLSFRILSVPRSCFGLRLKAIPQTFVLSSVTSVGFNPTRRNSYVFVSLKCYEPEQPYSASPTGQGESDGQFHQLGVIVGSIGFNEHRRYHQLGDFKRQQFRHVCRREPATQRQLR